MFGRKGVVGVKVAVFVDTLYDTVPGTFTEPVVVFTVKFVVVPLSDVGSISSLNKAVTVPGTGTVVPSPGVVDRTVGLVVSATVVNVHVSCTRRVLPARSFTPVLTVTVYDVLLNSGAVGVMVTVFVAEL